MTRRTLPLDGSDWELRGYLGVDAAARAAANPFATDAGWLPGRVPGSVLDDLWRAGEIADPYVERNSLLAEWVPERAWVYRRRFRLDATVPDTGRALLRFDGLDHAGQVFLDGVRMGRHEGPFVPFEIGVPRDALAAGDHELAVVVQPAPESEPQAGRTSRVRVHKPRMSYGWDFCPRLVHQGIWQPVSLEVVGRARIVDAWARPTLAADGARGDVELRVTLEAATAGDLEVVAELRDGGRIVASAEVVTAAPGGPSVVPLRLDVERPAIWWPNGLGEAVVHRLTVTAREAGGRVLDTRTIPVGFRRIELAPNGGGPPDARPYTFVVNGRPVYVNGWNWVPLDALYGVPRRERLEHLLRLAAGAGVNLLRAWGGGLIETEAFYDECDRLGIMVWQEFSQSSSGFESTPSSDPAFVDLMRREAEAILPLRRNHPSLAIWCGGNELEDERGPLDERSPVLAALRDVVERLDPGRAWLPTSPSGPRFHNRLDVIAADPDGLHDVHGPWEHQGLAGQHELYDRGTSLFNSEFGVEGMANRRTHEALIRPEHRWPATRANPVYRHLGDWWNNEPLVQEAFGGRLRDIEQLRRASQFLQAEGLRYAVEANRRRWPRNSGSIPWQFNESYPNAWCTSAVDHRGDPKPTYFAVRRAYAPAVVCARFDRPALGESPMLPFALWAWASGRTGEAVVQWRIVEADGTTRDAGSDTVELHGAVPVRARPERIAEMADLPDIFFLDLRLDEPSGATLATNRYPLSGGSDFGGLLDLMPATLAVELSADGDTWRLDVCHGSGPAAVGVRVEDGRPIDEPGWAEVDDGAFDLLPGERRTVAVRWAGAPAQPRRLRIDAWNVAAMDVAP